MKDDAGNSTPSAATLHAALLDYYSAPGKYQLTLRQPDLLFRSIRDILQLAAGRGSQATSASTARVREAARFFIRAALLYPGADHYAVLGFKGGSEPADLKERYRLLMRLIHPDFAHADGPPWPTDAAVRVNKAYEVLSSPALRREYDEQLATARPQRPPVAPPSPRMHAVAARRDDSPRMRAGARTAWALAAAAGLLFLLVLFPRQEPEHLVQRKAPPPVSDRPVALQSTTVVAPSGGEQRLALPSPVGAAAPPLPPPAPPAPEAQSARPAESAPRTGPAAAPPAPAPPAPPPAPPPAAAPAVAARSAPAASPPAAAQVARPAQPAAASAAGQSVPGPARPAPPTTPPAGSAQATAAVPTTPPDALRLRSAAPALESTAAVPAPPAVIQPVAIAPPPGGPETAAPAAAPVARVLPSAAPVPAGPSMSEAQPLLTQMLQLLESGSGEQLLRLLDADARQAPGAQALSRQYDFLVKGARPVRLTQAEFRGESRDGMLLVTGRIRFHAGEPTIGSHGQRIMLRAEFVSRGGKVLLTGLSAAPD